MNNTATMSNELRTVIGFCLEHAEQAPVARRVSLYRGVAEICADERLGAELRTMARELAAADKRCREFAFNFDLNGGHQ